MLSTGNSKAIATRLPMSEYVKIQKEALSLKMSMSEYLTMKLYNESNLKDSKLLEDIINRIESIHKGLSIRTEDSYTKENFEREFKDLVFEIENRNLNKKEKST